MGLSVERVGLSVKARKAGGGEKRGGDREEKLRTQASS